MKRNIVVIVSLVFLVLQPVATLPAHAAMPPNQGVRLPPPTQNIKRTTVRIIPSSPEEQSLFQRHEPAILDKLSLDKVLRDISAVFEYLLDSIGLISSNAESTSLSAKSLSTPILDPSGNFYYTVENDVLIIEPTREFLQKFLDELSVPPSPNVPTQPAYPPLNPSPSYCNCGNQYPVYYPPYYSDDGNSDTSNMPTNNKYYIVSAGDTLYGIARLYNVSVNGLIAANHIRQPYFVYTGQRLIIPMYSNNQVSPNYGAIHTIRVGETLFSIAVHYGTTVEALTYINGIVNPNQIYAGQVLRLK